MCRSILLLVLLGCAGLSVTSAMKINETLIEEFAKSKPAKANTKDIKYIQCDTCKKLIQFIKTRVDGYRPRDDPVDPNAPQGMRPKPVSAALTERDLSRMYDEACVIIDSSWMRKQDIVNTTTAEGKTYLGLKENDYFGSCGVECMTIQAACTLLTDESLDRDQLFSHILKKFKTNATLDGSAKNPTFEDMVCSEWARVCPAPPIPASYQREDTEWVALTPEQLRDEGIARFRMKRERAVNEGVTAIFELAEEMKGTRAFLFFEDSVKGELSSDHPLKHTTYPGHVWKVKINGHVVKTWEIEIEPVQTFTLRWEDVEQPRDL